MIVDNLALSAHLYKTLITHKTEGTIPCSVELDDETVPAILIASDLKKVNKLINLAPIKKFEQIALLYTKSFDFKFRMLSLGNIHVCEIVFYTGGKPIIRLCLNPYSRKTNRLFEMCVESGSILFMFFDPSTKEIFLIPIEFDQEKNEWLLRNYQLISSFDETDVTQMLAYPEVAKKAQEDGVKIKTYNFYQKPYLPYHHCFIHDGQQLAQVLG